MDKSANILIYDRRDGPARLAPILDRLGFAQHSIFVPEESIAHLDPLIDDLLITLGGPMGVYEADKHPYLNDVLTLLEKRVRADKPTLGICLGAQLIAAALGSKVYKGDNGYELGWNPLIVAPEGENHPIRHITGDYCSMFHWHQDTFDLPEGASLLASSSIYKNQIFSFGSNVLAIQSHPEVGLPESQEWIDHLETKRNANLALPINDFENQMRANLGKMTNQLEIFMQEWLDKIYA